MGSILVFRAVSLSTFDLDPEPVHKNIRSRKSGIPTRDSGAVVWARDVDFKRCWSRLPIFLGLELNNSLWNLY